MIDQGEIRRQEYVGRLNRVLDYIRANITGDLRLETLAQVANFSPFHFHRLFTAMVGETVNAYIRRIRMQRAASQLIYNPKKTITRIAVDCGFSSPSGFARDFRGAFGMSASQFRAGGQDSVTKVRETLSREGAEFYPEFVPKNDATPMKYSVEVKTMPEFYVAYVRHMGPYNEVVNAFGKLMRWAGPRGLLQFPGTAILAVYYDGPDMTPVSQLSCDACVTIAKGTPVEGEIGTMTIPGGQFAVAHVEIDVTQYSEAWDRLICEWLPRSGYQPDDRLCYELYLNDPDRHPEKKHIVDICEPIRPL
ncbi:AraC family transcriptional regulator [Candidatus Bipolaricaulota bacterium]|nr:AraC family transcriptional regulator [Candidatus Bipolaricaulota bacterium]